MRRARLDDEAKLPRLLTPRERGFLGSFAIQQTEGRRVRLIFKRHLSEEQNSVAAGLRRAGFLGYSKEGGWTITEVGHLALKTWQKERAKK